NAIFIMGNHEELLLRLCAGDKRIAAPFHRVGGRATLLSYGVAAEDYDKHELAELPEMAAHAVPQLHLDFISGFLTSWRCGTYFFTHAGVVPGIALDDQSAEDLRWIRDAFTLSDADHGAVIVHGHTVSEAVEERVNRIGIDTGAYASGTLTALGLQGAERWYLQT
ncbi:MAG: serine/threonine protein phosphatase, partial [Alphaproteobacteria bacterium]|nr:serine/threonine protein phosphatase [Alphaproteobacteria bacterium]